MAPGEINVIFGWAWMAAGFIAGMAMGFWAEKEDWLGGYGSLTRRYLRLAHIAFIALAIINILYGTELDSVGISESLKRLGSYLMLFGAVGMPLICVFAAFWRKIKYLLPLPASALLAGVVILVIGLVRS